MNELGRLRADVRRLTDALLSISSFADAARAALAETKPASMHRNTAHGIERMPLATPSAETKPDEPQDRVTDMREYLQLVLSTKFSSPVSGVTQEQFLDVVKALLDTCPTTPEPKTLRQQLDDGDIEETGPGEYVRATPETDKTKRAKRFAANAITVSLDGSDDLRADVVKIRDRLWEESKHATTPEPHPEYLRGIEDAAKTAAKGTYFDGPRGTIEGQIAESIRALAVTPKADDRTAPQGGIDVECSRCDRIGIIHVRGGTKIGNCAQCWLGEGVTVPLRPVTPKAVESIAHGLKGGHLMPDGRECGYLSLGVCNKCGAVGLPK